MNALSDLIVGLHRQSRSLWRTRVPSVFLGILCLAVVITTQFGCTRDAKISRHLAKGDRYFNGGEFEKAEIEYANVIQLDPKNPAAISKMAVMFSYEGRLSLASSFLPNARRAQPNDLDVRVRLALFDVAIGRLTEARDEALYVLQHRPDDEDAAFILSDATRTPNEIAEVRRQLQQPPVAGTAPALIALGLFDLREQKLDDADAKFQAALKLAPKSGGPNFARAILLTARKDQAGAETAYSKAADASPLWSPRRLRYAQFLLAEGKADEGKRYLTDLTKQAPYYLPAWMLLATVATNEKHYDEALGYYTKLLSRDPLNHDALIAQARVTFDKGDKTTAIAQLERVAKAFPKSPEPNMQLALYHWSMGNAEPAVACLNQVLAAAPGAPSAVLLLAEIDVRRGRAAEAVKSLNELVKKQPTLGPARLLLAQAYQAQGNLDAALAVYRQIEADFSGNPQPAYLMGTLLMQQNKPVAARQAFEKALKINPKFYPAFEQLVNVDLMEKRVADAKGRVKAHQIDEPNSAALQLLMAKIHLFAGETKEAETALLKVIELKPESPLAYYLLGELYLKTKQTDKGLERLQQSVAKNKGNVQALVLIASIQEQQGNFAEARKNYEAALALNPKLPAPLNNLALLYAEKFNEVDQAMDLAQRARDLAPQDPNIADTLGWVAFKKRQYARALPLLSGAVEKLPTSPEAQYHLGMAHYMLGHRDVAKATLEHSLALGDAFGGVSDARDALGVLSLEPNARGPEAEGILQNQLAKHPDDAAALTQLGSIYERSNQAERAKALYETALKTSPNNPAAALGLIRIHLARKDAAAALEVASSAHKLAPDNAEITHQLGRLAFASGNYTWAYSLLQEAGRQLPNDGDVQFDLALAAYAKGQLEAVDEAMASVLQADPPISRIKEAREFADLLATAADPARAVAAAARIAPRLQRDPADVPALMVLAAGKQQNLAWADAQLAYEKILAQYPDFSPAQRNLAIVCARQTANNAKTVAMAIKARSAYPADPELAKATGVLLYRAGEYSRAASALQECVRQETTDAEVLYYLGLAQSQLKDNKASERSLKRALELGLSGAQATEAQKVLSGPKARKT